MTQNKVRGFDYKVFRFFFYLYMIILNIIWLICCCFIAIFTLKWRYDMQKFTGKVFEIHFNQSINFKNKRNAKRKKNQKSSV